MRTISNYIHGLCFWGLIALLVLLFGYKVDIRTIWHEVTMGSVSIRIICIFLLVSGPVFLLLSIYHIVSSMRIGVSFLFALSIDFESTVWIPYKGFYPKGFIRSIREGSFRLRDLGVYLFRFITTASFWGLIIWGCITISETENGILTAFKKAPLTKTVIIVLIVIGGTILLNLIAKGFSYLVLKNEMEREQDREAEVITRKESYSSRGYIPVGCRACGGPYPSCKTSCNMFDN